MFDTKILIIIGIVICFLICYYFYDEISSTKRVCAQTHQKLTAVENKAAFIDKENSILMRRVEILEKKQNGDDFDSPAMTVSYNSDMVPNGNLSVRYVNISDIDAIDIFDKKSKGVIPNQSKPKLVPMVIRSGSEYPSSKKSFASEESKTRVSKSNSNFSVPRGELSDFECIGSPNKKRRNDINANDQSNCSSDNRGGSFSDDSGCKKERLILGNTEIELPFTPSSTADNSEYRRILSCFDANIETSELDVELNPDTVRAVSDSIHQSIPVSDFIPKNVLKHKKTAESTKLVDKLIDQNKKKKK